MLDEVVTADEAVRTGFANGFIDMSKLDPKLDWFDPSIIPAIPKLLDTDLGTLKNGMYLLNEAKDREKMLSVTRMEGEHLVKKWFQPDFPALMAKYMMQLQRNKKR